MVKKILYGIGGFAVFIIILAFIIPTPNPSEEPQEKNEAVKEEKITEQSVPQQEEKVTEVAMSDKCITLSEENTEKIALGLNTPGISLRGAQAVKAPERTNTYFIAVDMQGPGLEGTNDIATFATNNIEDLSLLISVDAVALEFFDWADGPNSDYRFSVAEKGVDEAKDCTREALK